MKAFSNKSQARQGFHLLHWGFSDPDSPKKITRGEKQSGFVNNYTFCGDKISRYEEYKSESGNFATSKF